MTNTELPADHFSYRIDFRYKKFASDLRVTTFTNATVVIRLTEPVPEPLQRQWTTIVQALNPAYVSVEIINVREING